MTALDRLKTLEAIVIVLLIALERENRDDFLDFSSALAIAIKILCTPMAIGSSLHEEKIESHDQFRLDCAAFVSPEITLSEFLI